MDLKSLMVDTKDAWVDYPGMDGFSVNIVNLGREKLMALRKGCMETKFDRKTRQTFETLNEKKFVREFAAATIIGWKGLTLEYLEQMILIDVKGQDLKTELEYTQDNAETLLSNSSDFDNWLNDAVFDLENFRSRRD